MSNVALVPCPICDQEPQRFFAGRDRIDVIACVNGCKPNWNSFVVHIRSIDVKRYGWDDIADCWNTIEAYDDEGTMKIRFDKHPKGYVEPEPDGAHLKWSPQISAERKAERSMLNIASTPAITPEK